MKKVNKILKTFLVFLICAVFSLPISADYNEETFEPEERITTKSGDWEYYPISDDTICICSYNGKEETITIPAELDGKRVIKVAGRKNIEIYIDSLVAIFGSGNIFPYTDTVKEVIISEGIISLGFCAFQSSKIEKITLPESLKYISFKAFDSCALTSLVIPENVEYIGDYAFGKSDIEEIYLPEGLEYIGEYAFEGSALKEVYIPHTVKAIGQYAFRNTQLEKIYLPGSIVKAEKGLAANCKNLKKAYIGEGVETLGVDLFANDRALEEIYFPMSLKSSERILVGNDSLKALHFAGTEYYNPLAAENEDLEVSMMKESWREAEGSEVVRNLNVTYGIYKAPIQTDKPALPDNSDLESSQTDLVSIILLGVTLVCFILTAVSITIFIRRTLGIGAKKKETELQNAKESFRPQVLGVWVCKKCGTPNSPISNYCYKCGRKGEH